MGHSNPCVMRENIVKAIGEDAYKALEKYAFPNVPVKYNVASLMEIRSQLRSLIQYFDDLIIEEAVI